MLASLVVIYAVTVYIIASNDYEEQRFVMGTLFSKFLYDQCAKFQT